MEPTRELIDALYREEILEARRLSLGEKLFLGGALFDDLCERMRAGIRSQSPGADDAHVERLLCEHLDVSRRLTCGP